MLDRKKAPEFQKINAIHFQEPETRELDNQLPLYVIKAGKQPVLKLEIIVRAGSWHEEKKGTSLLTTKLLKEGTKSKSAREISYLIDKYGAFLELNPGLDYSIVSLYTLSKHLPALLPVVKEILLEPSFPETELLTLKNIKIQHIKVNKEKTNILASQEFRGAIFGAAHPYGKILQEDDLKAIAPSDIQQFYNNSYQSKWELILSGEVREEDISLVNKSLGQHTLDHAISLYNYTLAEKAHNHITEKPKSLQSSIRIGKPFLDKGHPDYNKMLVVNEVLGGYFGSRLMKNIREDKGFTYGIQSNLVALKNAGYFVIGTDVKKENTSETIREIHHEISKLQETPVAGDELETVKNYMTGSFLGEINTAFALSDKFKMIHLHGLGYDYYQNYLETINSITAEEIQILSQKYLLSESLTEVVVGGI